MHPSNQGIPRGVSATAPAALTACHNTNVGVDGDGDGDESRDPTIHQPAGPRRPSDRNRRRSVAVAVAVNVAVNG
jgi:hypothetical protein